jgi:LiaI-LiaF-like transmembrane region
MSKSSWQHHGHRNRSLFWPLTLIILGLVFLAYNLGMLSDDLWSTLINLWPLLLVLIGLDGLLSRGGIVWPSLMIGLGVIFLLNNFGYLVLDVWQVILSLWPVLLIAIGFDILIGRRSWFLSIIGVVIVLAILVGSIGLMTNQAYMLAGQEISYPSEGVDQARMEFDIPVGTMTLEDSAETGVLLSGSVPEGGGLTVHEQYQVQGSTAAFKLDAKGTFVSVPGVTSPYRWEFRVAPDVPLELNVSQGVGSVNLDLSQLSLSDLNTSLGAGQVTVLLPDDQSFSAHLSAGMGQLVVIVPDNVGVRITSGTALAALSVPDSYVRNGNVYTSPDFSSKNAQVNLALDLAIGSVAVKEQNAP